MTVGKSWRRLAVCKATNVTMVTSLLLGNRFCQSGRSKGVDLGMDRRNMFLPIFLGVPYVCLEGREFGADLVPTNTENMPTPLGLHQHFWHGCDFPRRALV